MPTTQPVLCPQCGADVECGMALGKDECWCASYPPLMAVPAAGDAACLCERCLRERLARLPIARGSD